MLDATPLLRAYAWQRLSRLAAQDPASSQRAVLRALLRRAQGTRFGREHRFAALRDVSDYQRAVPLRQWEAFWSEYWQPAFPRLTDVSWPGTIPHFANTSGTTGAATKRIPVSRAMMRANRGAALDTLCWHLRARPHSRVLAGRNFVLGGSTALEVLAPGITAGDLSGLAAADIPGWARPRAFPPLAVALIDDWQRKIDILAPLSLTAEVTSISGTPSWLLPFFERVARLRPRAQGGARLAGLYPQLELLVHGGVGFAPYRERFAEWLEGGSALLREVYPASEGFFAVADRGDGEGLRLILDRGLFYEFIRPDDLASANPDRRWIADAELGVEYALVISSNAGLWSYVVGDTVTLIDRAPPRVLVSGRTSWSLSVAGEHLIGQELDAGMAAAAHALGGTVADYAAAPLPPDAAEHRVGHVFVVEFLGPADADAFARALDGELARRNADYAAHRRDDLSLRPPRVVLAPPGSFAAWMRSRGKLGGQHKVPRVIADPALLAGLLRFIQP
jgi:GH3 auxin-responsive promoter